MIILHAYADNVYICPEVDGVYMKSNMYFTSLLLH